MSNPQTPELLPCPWCGKLPALIYDSGNDTSVADPAQGFWFAECLGGPTPEHNIAFGPTTLAEVTRLWNHRAVPVSDHIDVRLVKAARRALVAITGLMTVNVGEKTRRAYTDLKAAIEPYRGKV